MSSIRRVFFYVVSLISLGITAAGIRVLFSLLFDLLFGGRGVEGDLDLLGSEVCLDRLDARQVADFGLDGVDAVFAVDIGYGIGNGFHGDTPLGVF